MNKKGKIIAVEFFIMLIIIIVLSVEMYIGNIISDNYYNEETIYINIPNDIPEVKPNIVLTTKKEQIYLALNDSLMLDYTLESDTNLEENITFTSLDENIVIVDENGLITGLNNGTTSIILTIHDINKEIKVTVTNLINKISPNIESNKKLLTCGLYTEEDNNLLDNILEDRINNVGLKTRAGVIAAARFLTLEFPYKISYFSENGRLITNNVTYYVDGEGRYYHKGLYLHESRYTNIISSLRGPNIWGCNIYMNVVGENRKNGLDCSGFITWVLVNGGYDPGDIGAGITNYYDLTDIGEKISIKNALNDNTLKVGDLLSGPNLNGGHIGILIGIKDNTYYVAESLWGYNDTFGVVVRAYNNNNMYSYFKWQINMDEFYGSDGVLTDFWV